MEKFSRRDFLRIAATAGLAASLPASLVQRAAALATDENLWPLNDFNIRELAKKPFGDSIRFIFCSDVHVPFDDRGTFKTIIKKANELDVDFVLFGGDCVQVGNPESYKVFLRELRKFKMPVMCAMGNHDTAFEDYADQSEWKKRFGLSHFKFDAGPARFIGLSNANYALKDDDYAFLEDAMKTGLLKFVFMHRPVNYVNKLYNTPMEDKEGRFREIVEKGKATAVFCGHEHHFAEYKVAGVKYITSGGAGGKLSTDLENPYHHFIIGKVSKNAFEFAVEKI